MIKHFKIKKLKIFFFISFIVRLWFFEKKFFYNEVLCKHFNLQQIDEKRMYIAQVMADLA